MKKLLIFSASTGEGHNQAAISLEELFSASEYKVIKLDGLKETCKILDYFITDGYKTLINNFPEAKYLTSLKFSQLLFISLL